MAIQVGFPQTSQDLIALSACPVAAFPHPCFHPPQIQPQHHYNDTPMCPNMLHPNSLISPSTSNDDFSINHPPLLPSFGNYDHEFDDYIKLQGQKLSMRLQEQRNQQVATLLNAVELNMLNSMRQKDEEIARAAEKRMELEDILNRVEAENEAWQRAALESETTMLSLTNSLKEMKEKAHSFNNVWADDARSCWDESGGDYKHMEEEEDDEEQMVACACKGCNYAKSCILFLPCRHLCACKACEPFLQACPVCTMPKKASIEASIF